MHVKERLAALVRRLVRSVQRERCEGDRLSEAIHVQRGKIRKIDCPPRGHLVAIYQGVHVVEGGTEPVISLDFVLEHSLPKGVPDAIYFGACAAFRDQCFRLSVQSRALSGSMWAAQRPRRSQDEIDELPRPKAGRIFAVLGEGKERQGHGVPLHVRKLAKGAVWVPPRVLRQDLIQVGEGPSAHQPEDQAILRPHNLHLLAAPRPGLLRQEALNRELLVALVRRERKPLIAKHVDQHLQVDLRRQRRARVGVREQRLVDGRPALGDAGAALRHARAPSDGRRRGLGREPDAHELRSVHVEEAGRVDAVFPEELMAAGRQAELRRVDKDGQRERLGEQAGVRHPLCDAGRAHRRERGQERLWREDRKHAAIDALWLPRRVGEPNAKLRRVEQPVERAEASLVRPRAKEAGLLQRELAGVRGRRRVQPRFVDARAGHFQLQPARRIPTQPALLASHGTVPFGPRASRPQTSTHGRRTGVE
eukprot:1143662-Prymnesium_polylepis.1